MTSFTPPTASPRLRDLAPESHQARTQGFLSSTTWLHGILVTETELAQNQGGAGWLQSRIPGDTTDDASQRMIRLGLTGTAGSVRYGVSGRSTGLVGEPNPFALGIGCFAVQAVPEILISAMGNYAGIRSSDGLIDTLHMGGRGKLARDIQRSQGWTTLISLDAGYNRMTHRPISAAGTEDISGLLRVVLASLSPSHHPCAPPTGPFRYWFPIRAIKRNVR